jgi:hypothetical protein
MDSLLVAGQYFLHLVYRYHFLLEGIGPGLLGTYGANDFRPVFAGGGLQRCYYFLSHDAGYLISL